MINIFIDILSDADISNYITVPSNDIDNTIISLIILVVWLYVWYRKRF